MKSTRAYCQFTEQIEGIWCDCCGEYFDDSFDLQEFICIQGEAGFGAQEPLEDGDIWDVDICPKCFFNAFGQIIRIH